MNSRLHHERGQALIEYAMIVSLIALISIIALQTTTGISVSHVINVIAGAV